MFMSQIGWYHPENTCIYKKNIYRDLEHFDETFQKQCKDIFSKTMCPCF